MQMVSTLMIHIIKFRFGIAVYLTVFSIIHSALVTKQQRAKSVSFYYNRIDFKLYRIWFTFVAVL